MGKKLPDFTFENNLWEQNYLVVGIDEVGRGALAGPLTIGAVVFSNKMQQKQKKIVSTAGISDSKVITPVKRTKLSVFIKKMCLYAKTVSIHTEIINNLGIINAWKQSVTHLVQIVHKNFPDNKIHLLIDGLPIQHIPYINDIPRTEIIKGDSRSISIAAASIIAKVERDSYMRLFSTKYPNYHWEQNKGYATKKHINAIEKHGVTPFHRDLYLRNIIMTV